MLSLNAILNIHKVALKNSLDKDIDTLVEDAYRYYSRTYSTPLYLAEEMITEAEVLRIFFEDRFNDMDGGELKEKVNSLYGYDKEAANSPIAGKTLGPVTDDQWVAEMNKKAMAQAEAQKKAQAEKAAAVKAQEIVKSVDQIIDEMNKKMLNIKAGALQNLKVQQQTVRRQAPNINERKT